MIVARVVEPKVVAVWIHKMGAPVWDYEVPIPPSKRDRAEIEHGARLAGYHPAQVYDAIDRAVVEREDQLRAEAEAAKAMVSDEVQS